MADRYAELVAALRAEFPRFRIVRKDASPLHRAIDTALRVITLGRMTTYLDSFQTTIGSTIYVTSDWDDWGPDRRYITLRHEAVHLRQFRTWTLPGMALAYLMLPLPMGLAWCRAAFEKAAFAESVRAAAEVWGPAHVRGPAYRDYVIEQFTTASYGWMWPFRRGLERWYDGVVAEIDAAGYGRSE